ncbi:MAG: alcohol dehydrogenase [Rhodothermales bacterium]|jgi:alcohol dehydrogenase
MGPGSLAELTHIAGNYDAGLALVITDPGVSTTDIPMRVCGFLETAGFRPMVLLDVAPNPRVADVDRMAESARPERPSIVVAVGGGSVLDAGKGVALLLTNPGSCADYEGRDKFGRPAAPLIAIPTTCGTGSEVTWVSVLSHTEQRRKISVKGDGLFPDWAIVDSDLLKTLPAHLVASTGMDAATHAIEAFVGKAANPASDELAAAALRLICGHIEGAVSDIEGNHEDRDAVMRGSTLAGMAFGNADVGGVHCLSEAIGGRHDLPHGLLNAALLVPVLRYHGEAAAARLLEIGRLSGIDDVLARLEALCAAVGIPAFGALGVPEDDFASIAAEAEANGSNASNPRVMRAVDYLTVLRGLV